jgi:hypothetical protein
MKKGILSIAVALVLIFYVSPVLAKSPKIAVEVEGVEGEVEGLTVDWAPSPSYFEFKLKNNTGQKVTIVWDETLFVNETDESSGVMHFGVKFIDKEKPMPVTVVPKGTSKADMVYPRDYAFYGRPNAWTLHGPRKRKFSLMSGVGKEEWQQRPIFFAKVTKKLMKAANKEDPKFDLAEFVKGLHYKVILALKVGEEKKEVTYKFKAVLK